MGRRVEGKRGGVRLGGIDTLYTPVLDRRVASVTNSNAGSVYLEREGLGVEKYAEILRRNADAKLYVYDKHGYLVTELEDSRTQMRVADHLRDAHGLSFMPVTKPAEITVEQMTIINEVKNTDVKVIVEREKELVELVTRAERLKGKI